MMPKAIPFAVYGDDNRSDYYASSYLFQDLALSTAALIPDEQLISMEDSYLVKGEALGKKGFLCLGERFESQPAVAQCSGTLIAPDLILTAGHCYWEADTCEKMSWVFDYRVEEQGLNEISVPASSVYRCQQVIHREIQLGQKIDFALIRLDRQVKNRPAAKLASEEVSVGTSLVLIGHSQGLPTKIAPDAEVLHAGRNHFYANLDAFEFNSGSGVFNALTGELQGILSGGNEDYYLEGNCRRNKLYRMEEGAERVTSLAPVIKALARLE